MTKRIFFFKMAIVSLFALYICLLLLPIKRFRAVGESAQCGKGECVIEASSGRILYESHGDLRLPMASTTKILTAITVLENCKDIQKEFAIPQGATGIEGSSVYLKSGEKYTAEELLYGLMLRSGNDCAVALALHCCGSIEKFSAKMNETAQKAGALNSRFSNPHGLPCENHYTTARDLAYIARYAMQNPIFRTIVSTRYYEPRGWKNKNKLLSSYEGAIGVKTGYTKEAGRCLVSSAKRDNMTLICVVLNCYPMYERSAELLDGAFQTYQMKPIIQSGERINVQLGEKTILGQVKEDFYYPLSDGEEEQLEFALMPNSAPIKEREILGQFGIYLSKRLLFFGNLYKL